MRRLRNSQGTLCLYLLCRIDKKEIHLLMKSCSIMQESILSLPIPPPGYSQEFACIFSLSVQFPSAGQEKLCNARPLGKEMITIARPWDTPTY